ncbi:MAG: hypothetical protein H0U60_13230 [Blastocatellia bacterium]|nr:hypothetical protein [Blastocatellia bacterium]
MDAQATTTTTTQGESGSQFQGGAVYRISCLPRDRHYIGASMWVSGRLACHRGLLNAGKHYNRYLQADWTDLGSGAFEFALVEPIWEADKHVWPQSYTARERARLKVAEHLHQREREWIALYEDRCYNISRLGTYAIDPPETPTSVEESLNYLAEHAYFGYGNGRADHIRVLHAASRSAVILALQRHLGGTVLGPYQSGRLQVYVWQIRGPILVGLVAQLERSLPPGLKREQFETWKALYAPKGTEPFTNCGKFPEVCASSAGYIAHRKRGDIACRMCLSCHGEYQKQRARKTKKAVSSG